MNRLAPVIVCLILAAAIAAWFVSGVGSDEAVEAEGTAAQPATPADAQDAPAPEELAAAGEPERAREEVEAVAQEQSAVEPALRNPLIHHGFDWSEEDLRELETYLAERAAEMKQRRISGRLRSESGAWSDLDRLLSGNLHLSLVSLDDRSVQREAALSRETDPGGEETIAFAFTDVPEGEYEFSVSSLEHHTWSPAKLVVSPPADRIEVWRLDVRDTIALAFRVLDADTLEPVDGWSAWTIRTEVSPATGVFFHAGPIDPGSLDDFPVDAELAWSVAADGYAPSFGTERDFLEEEDGRWVAEVRLRPGWGARFVVLGRAPKMRPLAGAEIRLDGRLVGCTRADGTLDVALDAAPQSLEVTWESWQRCDGPLPTGAERAFRGHLTPILLLEPEESD